MEHITVYKGTGHHAAFPHIIRLQDGDLLCVFREAPTRPGVAAMWSGNNKISHYHLDDSSRIALVRSSDDGRTWDPDTHVVVDESDGTQDINMAMVGQLPSGELVLNNHRWFLHMSKDQAEAMSPDRKVLVVDHYNQRFGGMVSDSLYMYRSGDGGRNWSAPEPFGIGGLTYQAHTGKDGVLQMPDGQLMLIFNSTYSADSSSGVYVVRSGDGGRTWRQPSLVALDPEGQVGFGEPPLLRLASGRLLTMMRTGEYLYQGYSDDDGWTWQGVKRSPIWGHPAHCIQLRSGRVLCAYGYRREPYGIRACLSDDEGETWDVGNEFVIRGDGLHRDLGYPASVLLEDGRVLTVYYFHDEEGMRHIGGSIYSEDEILP